MIAEANRDGSATSGASSGATLAEALKGPNRPTGWFRFEAGALLGRPRGFWRERRIEPSEAAFAPIEREDPPTIDDYARTFAALPPPSLPVLFTRVARRPLAPYLLQKEGLILWGSLSDAERATARSGARLPLRTLSAATQARIREVMLAAILEFNGELVVPRPPDEEAVGAEFALRCALVGVRSGPEFAIRFEETDEIFRAPWIPVAPNSSTGRKGEAVWVSDERGAGLRFFIPNPETK